MAGMQGLKGRPDPGEFLNGPLSSPFLGLPTLFPDIDRGPRSLL